MFRRRQRSEIYKDTPTSVVVFLSGRRRGRTQRLVGDHLRIGTAPDTDIRVAGDDSEIAAHHATLRRHGSEWELHVVEDGRIWVHGEPAHLRRLESGDLIEVGKGGPVLRYLVFPPGRLPYRSPQRVFSDCVECSRKAPGLGSRLAYYLRMPFDFLAEVSPRTRGVSLLVAASLLLAAGSLAYSLWIGGQVRTDRMRLAGVAELVDASRQRSRLTEGELGALRDKLDAELEERLAQTEGRVQVLEERSAAAAGVIADASPSILFLQGSYGFKDPDTDRLVRFAVAPGGGPQLGPGGEPLVTLDGDGPPVESLYTGTGFVVDEGGLILTNRHVAEPWKYEASAQAVLSQGLAPVHHRFVGYLPGQPEPFDVELAGVSDQVDLAVLRCAPVAGEVVALDLDARPALPGTEVVVMGYPTGIRALLARIDEGLVRTLMQEPGMDFWTVARRLAAEGHIGPLATRGIVGQVTAAAVVYDAETSGGGSGGPVLGLDGKVVAINTAILTEFGGSNMGIPAIEALSLLESLPDLSENKEIPARASPVLGEDGPPVAPQVEP